MNLLLTQAEYAAHRGVGKSAVSNWKAKGLLVFGSDPARPGKQLVDVVKTDLVVGGSIDPTRGRPRSAEVAQVENPPPAGTVENSPRLTVGRSDPLAEARLDDFRERTLSRRIENGKALGLLVEIAEYERRSGEMGRKIRERTEGLIRKLAERLAAETDPRVIIGLLSEEFSRLFERVASEIETEASAEMAADAVLAQVEAAAEEVEPPEGE